MNRSPLSRRQTVLGFAILCIALMLTPAYAQDVEKKPEYLRHIDLGADGALLQAEIVRFRNANGTVVDLVSAIHVADEAYFADLNKRFDSYDSVLYEMVKPKDIGAPLPGHESDSGVSQLQRFLKDNLALSFQLDAVDYQKANFVHADLDAETFQQMQEQRGESLMGLMLQSMMQQMLNPPPMTGKEPTLEELLAALLAPDRPRQLKLLMAPTFSKMEDILAGLDGPDGSVLVTERNKAAVAQMKKQLAIGDKKIAIFFGAAHMPGIGKMIEELGFQRASSEWVTAWDMRSDTSKPVPDSALPDDPKLIEQPEKHLSPVEVL